MTFHRIRDVSPPAPTELVCRQSSAMHLIPIAFGLAVIVGVFFIPADGFFRWVRWFIAAFFGLFTLLFWGLLRRSLGPEGWLLRINPRGIWIKFRSYANAHFSDDDEVILQLQPSEIEWVGLMRERSESAGDDETASVTERQTYVDIGLKPNVDVEAISRRLKGERLRESPGKRVKTTYRDYPVRLVEDRVLRLQWRSGSSFIVPSARKALAALSRFAPIHETRQRSIDTAKPAAEKAQQENQIIELLERGDRIGAVKLARRCYGYSVTEAQQFVEGLVTSSESADTQSR